MPFVFGGYQFIAASNAVYVLGFLGMVFLPMSSRRIKIAAAGALAAGSTVSQGSIVVFDINPDVTGYTNGAYTGVQVNSINLQQGTFDSTHFGAFTFTTYYFDILFDSSEYLRQATVDGLQDLALLSAGSLVGSGTNFTTQFSSTYKGDPGIPTGLSYVGMRLTQGGKDYYGWFEIDADVAGYANMHRKVTFTRFAFNDVAGQAILAGQTVAAPVPEASTLGFAGGLFGLVVAAHLRRRKAAQAAAPDSLLKLAAGEGVRN